MGGKGGGGGGGGHYKNFFIYQSGWKIPSEMH